MGELHHEPFQFTFNGFLKVAFQGSRVASDAGLLLVRELIGQAETFDRSDRIVLDMDSSESPVHGQQEGSAYTGHFESVCYHPLFLFNDHGDCLAAKLRSGNVHSADDWDQLLVPEIERQQAEGKRVAFRADAAFAKPEIYDALETHGVQHAIRIPANETLEWEIADLLVRPAGRPSHKPLVRYKSFSYQAGSWTPPRRIVAKVEHHAGELFPRVGFIVTNLALPSRAVVRLYNKRGTAEQWIKEGKQAAHWTRLSCHRFRANEVRLQLSVLAYNLGNLWRRLVLPKRIDTWSLTSLQQRLVKLLPASAGGRSPGGTPCRGDAPAHPGTAGPDGLMGDGCRMPAGRREGATRAMCGRSDMVPFGSALRAPGAAENKIPSHG